MPSDYMHVLYAASQHSKEYILATANTKEALACSTSQSVLCIQSTAVAACFCKH